MKKQVIALTCLLSLSGCHHDLVAQSASGQVSQAALAAQQISLILYEASEFEPTWSFKLNMGTFQMRRLDPVNGLNMIVQSGTITSQTPLGQGNDRLMQGTSAQGQINVVIDDMGLTGGCSHSGSGITYRDDVMITFDGTLFRGCGGPQL